MRFPRMILLLVPVLCTLLLAACVGMYPLGMNEEEWNRLTPQEQLEAREKQAAINEQRRQERIAQEERKEREKRERMQAILDDPYLLEFVEGFCIGGDKCPDGCDDDEASIYLGGRAYVNALEFVADDNIGHKSGGKIAVYADDELVAEHLDIKRRGSHYRVNVRRKCRNVVFRAETDDEVRFHWAAIYGDRDGRMTGGTNIIIINN